MGCYLRNRQVETIKNKNVLLVGATGGIGSKTAKLLSGNGANLFLVSKSSIKLASLAEELKIPRERTFALDISSPEEVSVLKDRFFSQFPVIDVLINAAGIGIIKPLETISDAEFLRTLNYNLYGPFLLLKAFIPAMKETKKGLVIHIPGILGKVPMSGAAAYCASKYGLTGMMQSIREEVKRTEIRITNLFLGGVDTPFWDSIEMRVQREKMVLADEAAKAIWFLCQQPVSGVVNEMVVQPFNHQVI